MKNLIYFFNLIFASCFFAITSNAQIVTSSEDDGSIGTLRQQINIATPGSTISFASTVTHIDLSGELVINKNLTIQGSTSSNTVLDGNAMDRILRVTSSSVTLNNLTITNGLAADGGGILNQGMLTLNNCMVTNCVANGPSGSGGGIYNDSEGNLIINNSSITFNTSNRAGGGIEDNSGQGLGITLNTVELTDNNTGVTPAVGAPGNGGGLHITGPGDAIITDCVILRNIASLEGGGLWNGTGTMDVSGTTINNNSAAGNLSNEGGGGLFNAGGTLNIETCLISTNTVSGTSGSGGGVLNDMGILTINNTEISGNTSVRAGGGIEDNSMEGAMLTLNNVQLLNNNTASSPGNGGGLHITGPGNSIIMGCTVTGNLAASEGGGLWNGTGIMEVESTTINNNSVIGNGADQGGGGLFNAGGMLIVEGCAIMGNTTSGTSTSGGGILNDKGVLTVMNTEITDNSSIRAGGGIEDNSVAGVILTLSNVELLSNSTGASPGNGGGLHITGPGDSNITECIVSNNTAAAEGGGLWNGTGIMTVTGGMINDNIASGNAVDNGGGGLFNNGGTLIVSGNATIQNNLATGASGSGGGLLSTAGNVTIENTIFSMNAANRAGGAIEIIDGNLMFTSSSMIDNDVNGSAGLAAPGNGGGIHITGNSGIITITNAMIANNEAASEGGGVWNQNGTVMNISMSTIDNNTSYGNAIDNGGAGCFNNGGVLNISNTTISNNRDEGSEAAGAGIHNTTTGEVNILLSTISSNSSKYGGGIYNNGNTITINASTIANNEATQSGGGIESPVMTTLENTIVAQNTSPMGIDVSGILLSENYNLIGNDDLDNFSAMNNDIENTNPTLGPLEMNGNTTATHSLNFGSPAYNAGDPEDLFTDQNNKPIFGGRRDIGAHESQEVLSSLDNISIGQSGISVFPNPTSNVISIEIPEEFGEEVILELYDSATGKLINHVNINNRLNNINLAEYPNGTYIVKLTSENLTTSQMVIKTN